jgi:hypothetical protein
MNLQPGFGFGRWMKRAAVAVLAVAAAMRYAGPSGFENLFGARSHTSQLQELTAASAIEHTPVGNSKNLSV